MSLKAIIIRADGVLGEIGELERVAMNKVFSEAGYQWACDRPTYYGLARLPARSDRIAAKVAENITRTGRPADRDDLIGAMTRRLKTMMIELLDNGALGPRPGIVDLTLEAKREGLHLALVSTLDQEETAALLRASFAPAVGKTFDVVVSQQAADGAESRLYRDVVEKLGIPPAACLALEATPQGLAAAVTAGLPTAVTLSLYSGLENLEDALAVFKNLPGAANPPLKDVLGPYGPEERAHLLTAVRNLHAGLHDVAERSEIMRVSAILQTKGSAVKTVHASETIRAFAMRLRAESVGAMVVVSEKNPGVIEGIISERDVARGLAEYGSEVAALKVSDLMTKAVIVCSPEDSIVSVSRTMTQRRIRHLPVLENGKLAGLISIGDVLSHRLDQMQQEVNVLRDYAIARS